MSAKFTPGPWEAVCNDIEECRPVGDSGLRFWSVGNYSEQYRGDVCGVHAAEHIGGITIDERNANAHLIAAAPDLYEASEAQEAAQDARADCRECDGDGDWTHCGECSLRFGRAIDLRRAALAKARGDQ